MSKAVAAPVGLFSRVLGKLGAKTGQDYLNPQNNVKTQTPDKDVAADSAKEEIRKRRVSSGQRSTILAGASSLEGTQATKKTLLGE